MFTAIILFTIAITILLYNFESIKHFVVSFIELKKLPGPPTKNYIVGNIAHLHTSSDNVFKILREWAKKYYPIYNISVIHIIATCLLTPEDFELVLSNPRHNEKSKAYDLLHNWLGTGLLTSTGNKWSTRRRILTPAFHFSILKQFVSTFNDETEKLIDILNKECHKPFVSITQHITLFTLKTIAETAMGTKLKFDTEKEISYKKAVYEIGQILLYKLLHSWFVLPIVNFFCPKYFQEKRTIKILHNFTKEVIEERERTFKDIDIPKEEDEVYTGKTRLAMLDLLLTAKKKEGIIDNEGIREEVDTFMFEGHDTTAAALNFALMLIACHKVVQDRIVQEIGSVLGDLRKKPSFNDLQEMKYLEMVIKEVLRLYPSVHFISRKMGEDLVTHTGYLVPKGSIVHLHIYDLHHNPEIYPDPEKFDPERFLPENCQNRHPFAYVPFSAGPRNCIGQRFAMLELKTALCGVLANFILEPVDTPQSIVLIIDMVLRTKNEIKVKFVKRYKVDQK